jgi:flagellar protein FliL
MPPAAAAAANTTVVAPAPTPVKSKKKLIIIASAVLVALIVVAATAIVSLKRRAAAAEGADGTPAAAAVSKHETQATPVFVPLDSFTVNLADRDAERYAQVGITLEVTDTSLVDQIKAYMPAIRNNVLMAISERNASELMTREGKAKLADKIRRETSRALGYDVPRDQDGDAAAVGRGHRKAKDGELPITAVQFSNFIIQ